MSPGPSSFSPAKETRRITEFIARTVAEAGAKGVVVGISGGIDSAVTGDLCVRALGSKSVLAALLHSEHTPKADTKDAQALVGSWGTEAVSVEIRPIVRSFEGMLGSKGDRISNANIQARVRMTTLYYLANSRGLLVAGTGDRSEEELGFFTKYGDGGADFLPIAHLYKTQVRALGAYLGLPKRVVEKPSSPQLWPGHTAREELPADYEDIDEFLHYLLDQGLGQKAAASKAGISASVAKKISDMRRRSSHKRSLPPSLVSPN